MSRRKRVQVPTVVLDTGPGTAVVAPTILLVNFLASETDVQASRELWSLAFPNGVSNESIERQLQRGMTAQSSQGESPSLTAVGIVLGKVWKFAVKRINAALIGGFGLGINVATLILTKYLENYSPSTSMVTTVGRSLFMYNVNRLSMNLISSKVVPRIAALVTPQYANLPNDSQSKPDIAVLSNQLALALAAVKTSAFAAENADALLDSFAKSRAATTSTDNYSTFLRTSSARLLDAVQGATIDNIAGALFLALELGFVQPLAERARNLVTQYRTSAVDDTTPTRGQAPRYLALPREPANAPAVDASVAIGNASMTNSVSTTSTSVASSGSSMFWYMWSLSIGTASAYISSSGNVGYQFSVLDLTPARVSNQLSYILNACTDETSNPQVLLVKRLWSVIASRLNGSDRQLQTTEALVRLCTRVQNLVGRNQSPSALAHTRRPALSRICVALVPLSLPDSAIRRDETLPTSVSDIANNLVTNVAFASSIAGSKDTDTADPGMVAVSYNDSVRALRRRLADASNQAERDTIARAHTLELDVYASDEELNRIVPRTARQWIHVDATSQARAFDILYASLFDAAARSGSEQHVLDEAMASQSDPGVLVALVQSMVSAPAFLTSVSCALDARYSLVQQAVSNVQNYATLHNVSAVAVQVIGFKSDHARVVDTFYEWISAPSAEGRGTRNPARPLQLFGNQVGGASRVLGAVAVQRSHPPKLFATSGDMPQSDAPVQTWRRASTAVGHANCFFYTASTMNYGPVSPSAMASSLSSIDERARSGQLSVTPIMDLHKACDMSYLTDATIACAPVDELVRHWVARSDARYDDAWNSKTTDAYFYQDGETAVPISSLAHAFVNDYWRNHVPPASTDISAYIAEFLAKMDADIATFYELCRNVPRADDNLARVLHNQKAAMRAPLSSFMFDTTTLLVMTAALNKVASTPAANQGLKLVSPYAGTKRMPLRWFFSRTLEADPLIVTAVELTSSLYRHFGSPPTGGNYEWFALKSPDDALIPLLPPNIYLKDRLTNDNLLETDRVTRICNAIRQVTMRAYPDLVVPGVETQENLADFTGYVYASQCKLLSTLITSMCAFGASRAQQQRASGRSSTTFDERNPTLVVCPPLFPYNSTQWPDVRPEDWSKSSVLRQLAKLAANCSVQERFEQWCLHCQLRIQPMIALGVQPGDDYVRDFWRLDRNWLVRYKQASQLLASTTATTETEGIRNAILTQWVRPLAALAGAQDSGIAGYQLFKSELHTESFQVPVFDARADFNQVEFDWQAASYDGESNAFVNRGAPTALGQEASAAISSSGLLPTALNAPVSDLLTQLGGPFGNSRTCDAHANNCLGGTNDGVTGTVIHTWWVSRNSNLHLLNETADTAQGNTHAIIDLMVTALVNDLQQALKRGQLSASDLYDASKSVRSELPSLLFTTRPLPDALSQYVPVNHTRWPTAENVESDIRALISELHAGEFEFDSNRVRNAGQASSLVTRLLSATRSAISSTSARLGSLLRPAVLDANERAAIAKRTIMNRTLNTTPGAAIAKTALQDIWRASDGVTAVNIRPPASAGRLSTAAQVMVPDEVMLDASMITRAAGASTLVSLLAANIRTTVNPRTVWNKVQSYGRAVFTAEHEKALGLLFRQVLVRTMMPMGYAVRPLQTMVLDARVPVMITVLPLATLSPSQLASVRRLAELYRFLKESSAGGTGKSGACFTISLQFASRAQSSAKLAYTVNSSTISDTSGIREQVQVAAGVYGSVSSAIPDTRLNMLGVASMVLTTIKTMVTSVGRTFPRFGIAALLESLGAPTWFQSVATVVDWSVLFSWVIDTFYLYTGATQLVSRAVGQGRNTLTGVSLGDASFKRLVPYVGTVLVDGSIGIVQAIRTVPLSTILERTERAKRELKDRAESKDQLRKDNPKYASVPASLTTDHAVIDTCCVIATRIASWLTESSSSSIDFKNTSSLQAAFSTAATNAFRGSGLEPSVQAFLSTNSADFVLDVYDHVKAGIATFEPDRVPATLLSLNDLVHALRQSSAGLAYLHLSGTPHAAVSGSVFQFCPTDGNTYVANYAQDAPTLPEQLDNVGGFDNGARFDVKSFGRTMLSMLQGNAEYGTVGDRRGSDSDYEWCTLAGSSGCHYDASSLAAMRPLDRLFAMVNPLSANVERIGALAKSAGLVPEAVLASVSASPLIPKNRTVPSNQTVRRTVTAMFDLAVKCIGDDRMDMVSAFIGMHDIASYMSTMLEYEMVDRLLADGSLASKLDPATAMRVLASIARADGDFPQAPVWTCQLAPWCERALTRSVLQVFKTSIDKQYRLATSTVQEAAVENAATQSLQGSVSTVDERILAAVREMPDAATEEPVTMLQERGVDSYDQAADLALALCDSLEQGNAESIQVGAAANVQSLDCDADASVTNAQFAQQAAGLQLQRTYEWPGQGQSFQDDQTSPWTMYGSEAGPATEFGIPLAEATTVQETSAAALPSFQPRERVNVPAYSTTVSSSSSSSTFVAASVGVATPVLVGIAKLYKSVMNAGGGVATQIAAQMPGQLGQVGPNGVQGAFNRYAQQYVPIVAGAGAAAVAYAQQAPRRPGFN